MVMSDFHDDFRPLSIERKILLSTGAAKVFASAETSTTLESMSRFFQPPYAAWPTSVQKGQAEKCAPQAHRSSSAMSRRHM